MALIACPECGKQISDKAVSCPSCGLPSDCLVANNPYNKSTGIHSPDEDTFRSLTGELVRGVVSSTKDAIKNSSSEELKQGAERRLLGLLQFVGCIILTLILVAFGNWLFAFITIPFGLRGLWVMLSGSEESLGK